MKVEIRAGNGKQPWYFRIVAKNGRVLCHSENYARRQSAEKAALLIVSGVKDADIAYPDNESLISQCHSQPKATHEADTAKGNDDD